MNEFDLLKKIIKTIDAAISNGQYQDADDLSKVYQRIKSVHTPTSITLPIKGE